MSRRHFSAFQAAVVSFAALLLPISLQAIGFQPISQEELQMKSEPGAPGAPAIILFRQVDRDDNGRTSHEDIYYRIKIFTEDGRKYANVEIPFFKGNDSIVGVHGRTIRPDGSIVEFDGKVLEKTIVKDRGRKVLVKAFTLSDVQVGSIIEYYYTDDLQEYSLFESHWILSDELYTKNARFSLKPYKNNAYNNFRLRWTWQNLPAGASPKEGPDQIVRMDASAIPAFQEEDFMPPANELKARVDFIYSEDVLETDTNKYWQKWAKKHSGALESFVGKRKDMEGVVAQIVGPNDPPEVKLRKLYDRVQQIRNTSYEVRKTEQEEKRDKEKEASTAEGVWKKGYGDGVDLTWLYLAMVRAAGFEAYGCMVSDRNQYFFSPKTMEGRKLDANVVLVKLNGKDLYFDPGAAFTPFGLLTWPETGVAGLRLDKDGGTWIQTTLPHAVESQVIRKAKLKLNDTGDLEGKLTITYTGLEGMYRRLEERHSDDVERKKDLEDYAKEQIPVASEVELTNKPDWSSSENPLVAEFDLKVTGWASNAGKRALLPVGLFSARSRSIFDHANRVQPVYFEYPYENLDDLTIELPAAWQVSSVPPSRDQDSHVIHYALKIENAASTLHVTRTLDIDFMMLEQKYYPALRNFFQTVRTGDEEQVVLQPGVASASN